MKRTGELKIHAICLALNEEHFIENQLSNLYPLCSGISILTQYDRDWYGVKMEPDRTVDLVKNFPDPEGKIQLVLRRWRDQAAALNSEMWALSGNPHRGVKSHGAVWDEICRLHDCPDYFLIIDADEFYEPTAFREMVKLLECKRPRGLRVWGINYVRDWHHYFPHDILPFLQFGFLKPGLTLESRRTYRWNESRLQKLFRLCHLPDFSARLFGFMTCPFEVGHFHHACWVGSEQRIEQKNRKSTHRDEILQEVQQGRKNSEIRELEKSPELCLRREVEPFLRAMKWPEGWINRDL